MKHFSLLFSLLILLSACKPSRPSGILSEKKMSNILVDYHLALAMADLQVGDLQENRYILTQAALKKHHVTEAEFDSSLVYWCKHSEKMVGICENVTKRLTYMAESQGVERKEKKNPYSFLTTEGDTANIWSYRNSVVLIPNVIDNIYSFTIDADSTYLKGDYFMWTFKTHFLTSDNSQEAYALLSVQYENDSIVGVSQRITSNRQLELRLQCASKYKDTAIRSINGSIYLPLRKHGFGILSIKDFILVRYHDKNLNKKQEENSEQQDSIKTLPATLEPDTNKVRQNPYDIRGKQNDKRTINIVRDKPLRESRRQR